MEVNAALYGNVRYGDVVCFDLNLWEQEYLAADTKRREKGEKVDVFPILSKSVELKARALFVAYLLAQPWCEVENPSGHEDGWRNTLTPDWSYVKHPIRIPVDQNPNCRIFSQLFPSVSDLLDATSEHHLPSFRKRIQWDRIVLDPASEQCEALGHGLAYWLCMPGVYVLDAYVRKVSPGFCHYTIGIYRPDQLITDCRTWRENLRNLRKVQS